MIVALACLIVLDHVDAEEARPVKVVGEDQAPGDDDDKGGAQGDDGTCVIRHVLVLVFISCFYITCFISFNYNGCLRAFYNCISRNLWWH